ncbi:tripartite-type tricarboxylate transporter receptor subunit TctC [Variovorax sp. TBS-050B]|nr:tripartite-type tricarboxylate transporter receptor subunit TctC [Variovorax sp. TBS-050B]
MNTSRRGLLACAALAALTGALPAAAQEAWPTQPVRLIVPYAAGGFADTRARKIAEVLGRSLGQPVVIENKGGAGGVTGTDVIAKASDGHTFGFGSPGPLVTNPMLMKKLPYDARKAFKPIVLIERAPLFLTTAPNQDFKSVRELVDFARANPGRLSYGSSGVGGAHHLWASCWPSRPAPS